MNVFDPESVALEGIRKMKEFFQSLGLKITLSDLGIKDDRIDEMADKCTDNNNRTIGNFVKLNRDAVKKILIEAK
jgi:alcohol dehydrogenase YqhD (iron-dependent ADH family)